MVASNLRDINSLLASAHQLTGALALQGIELSLDKASFETVLAAQAIEDRNIIQNQLNTYLSVTEVLDFKKDFDHNHLHRFLKRFGLHSKDDIDKAISPHDVIEVYNLQGQQLFRNLEIFRYTSYDLTELLVSRWTDLYRRPTLVDEQIMAEWGRVVGTSNGEAVPLKVSEHVMEECGARRNKILINFKSAWLLFDGAENKAGILITQAASKVDAPIAFI